MTPEQVEKVRVKLQGIIGVCTLQAHGAGSFKEDWLDIREQAAAALAALNGKQEEVWEAHPDGRVGDWRVQNADTDWIIAEGLSEADARRIARLPALERAARDAARFLERSGGADPASEHETVREALYTALTDNTEA